MNKSGKVIWITGLSGSGKTTLAKAVFARLRADKQTLVMLEGDEMREAFVANTANHSNHGRDERMDLWNRRFTDPLEDAETFRLQVNYLNEIGAKPASLDEIEGQFMGLIKFSPKGWSHVKSKLSKLTVEKLNRLDSTGLLQNLITDGLMIGAVEVNSPWAEVDGEKDLLVYNKDTFLSQQWKDALIKGDH